MLETTSPTASLLPAETAALLHGHRRPGRAARGDRARGGHLRLRAAHPDGAHGHGLHQRGRINLRNAEHALSREPLDPSCPCPACARFSRGAIRHFVMQKEILGIHLLTEHNLTFLFALMAERGRRSRGPFHDVQRALERPVVR